MSRVRLDQKHVLLVQKIHIAKVDGKHVNHHQKMVLYLMVTQHIFSVILTIEGLIQVVITLTDVKHQIHAGYGLGLRKLSSKGNKSV